jgi:hypothetical protein
MPRLNPHRNWQAVAQESAQDPGNWLFAADTLKESADVLLRTSEEARRKLVDAFKADRPDLAETLADIAGEPFLLPVYLLLAGLAIENVAKGIAVAHDPTHIKPGKGGSLTKWGHIGAQLFDELGIPLDEAETALVERLRDYVIWAGRYPAPQTGKQLEASRVPDRPARPAAIDALFDRLRSELVAVIPAEGASDLTGP